MLGSISKDFPAYILPTGEKDLVKLLVKKSLILCPSAGDNIDVFRRKTIFDQCFENSGGSRRIGAGLYDNRIARSQCIDQWVNGKKYGIVPGAHNQYVPVRRGGTEAMGRKLCDGSVYGFCLGEMSDMSQHPVKFRQRESNLAHIAFAAALSQISLQRICQCSFMTVDGSFKLSKCRYSVFYRQCVSGREKILLLIKYFLYFNCVHFIPPSLTLNGFV